jgi:hypothetical protein
MLSAQLEVKCASLGEYPLLAVSAKFYRWFNRRRIVRVSTPRPSLLSH